MRLRRIDGKKRQALIHPITSMDLQFNQVSKGLLFTIDRISNQASNSPPKALERAFKVASFEISEHRLPWRTFLYATNIAAYNCVGETLGNTARAQNKI